MAVDLPMTVIISMHAMTLILLALITPASLMTAAVLKMKIQEG